MIMDFVFLLSAKARGRFLQSAARILGCSYICLWSPLPHQSNHLASVDGWHQEDDGSHWRSPSGSVSLELFKAYRNSLFSIDSSCVPGSAYKGGLTYVELGESELMISASMQIQRQFYQEAGIKTAVFMGCRSGEIELGMATLSNGQMYTQMSIQQVFSEECIQRSLLGDPFPAPDQGGPSSSSSSFRSLSVGSPEYSSLLLTKAGAHFMPREVGGEQALLVPPHQMSIMQGYSRHRNVQLPTPADDDAAITRAMLAAISSPSTSSSPPPLFNYQSPRQDQAQQSRRSRPVGAFEPYNPALAPDVGRNPAVHGQKMVKTAVSILRRIYQMRYERRMQEPRTASNQLHHMISERRRREKLNESFHALRMLLPPCTKKDKASVLSNAREFVNTLKARISELEERHRMLEMQLQPADETKEVGVSTETVEVQITRASESTSHAQRINLRVTVRVECNMIDLVLHILECLKEMGDISLVSVDASTGLPQANTFARLNFTLQVQASDWVEELFKEAVTRAVDAVVARPAATTP
ncbi:putative transcription factor bHLH041 isoform X2 [Phoenix dactylifera]|uniref:Transcription factor bHLH041 isoform X2 n=1 Tax=Phoenix dactylifera TaxID=42345 RepID=A0A8B7C7D6_PHODC|nr:putative transcription factor bHLH041 isoform X2 [Phoenix dactylifera]